MPDHLQDIQDGVGYTKLCEPGRFLSYPEHTGLILNAHGVATFKSTSHSIWPIYLAVTSLPPHLRMRRNYLLLAGAWFGPKKPDLDIILKPVLDNIDHLYYNGIQVKHINGIKVVRAVLLLGVFDLPAKAAVADIKQFNGQYGCLYCTNPGKALKPGSLVYLPQQCSADRTYSEMKNWASQAVTTGKAVFGVKGRSILDPHIDITTGIPIDYMHAILEGVTKQFCLMWFNSKNHRSSFYLGRFAKQIDSKFKPPAQFHRSPRSINNIRLWKAAEFRVWLLFYSVPVLRHFLPAEYLHHWCLLVFATHLLLSKNLPRVNIQVAEDSLRIFYKLIPDLCGDAACTANVHSLIYVTKFVKLWGPLWTHSLFGFENMNGHVRRLFHGSRQVLDQLVFYVTAGQSLFFQAKNATDSEKNHFSFFSLPIATSRFEGKVQRVVLPVCIHQEIEKYTGRKLSNHHHLSSRYRNLTTVFSSEYFLKQERSRDSSVCFYSTLR